MSLDKICDMLETVNKYMREAGLEQQAVLGTDNFKITGKEVIITMPFTLTIRIPKESLGGSDAEISRAVSQAISQAVSVNK